jgi:serine/threonine-protein kinase
MTLDEAEDPRFAARFQREAELMAKLRSEHAVRVHDVGRLSAGQPFIAMEYLDGRDLRAVVREDGPCAISTGVAWSLQACEGVAEAHARGIVHRDLKPTNLLLTRRSDGLDLIKVLDYGVSKPPKSDDEISQILTQNTAVLGSPRYMSPEQLRTPHDVDARTDVWALASILHELLTGRSPFDGPTTAALCAAIIDSPPMPLRQLRPDAPAELEAASLRALAKDREARTQSVAALASDLVQALGSPPDLAATARRIERILAPSSSRLARTGPVTSSPAGRPSRGVSIAALVVGGAAGAVGVFLLTRPPPPRPPPPPDGVSLVPITPASPSESAAPPPAPSPSAAPPPSASGSAVVASRVPPRTVGRPSSPREPDVPEPPPAAPPPPKRNPLDDRH